MIRCSNDLTVYQIQETAVKVEIRNEQEIEDAQLHVEPGLLARSRLSMAATR